MEKFLETTWSILGGTQVTLQIFLVTLLLSLPLGLLAAMARLSKLRIVRHLMEVYIWIMRGLPLMLQLFICLFRFALSAHIFIGILQFDLFCNGNAVFRNNRRTVFFVIHNHTAAGSERYFYRFRNLLNSRKQFFTGIFIE